MPRRQWTGHLLVLANVVLAAAVTIVVLALIMQRVAPATRGIAPPPSVSTSAAAPPPQAPPRETTPSAPAIESTANVDAYRGLASWVDIYDTRAWSDPAATVADMARHGVRTLFIETANSRSTSAIPRPAQLRTFISQAHAHKMAIVAWYLPDMRDPSLDYSRIAQAIRFAAPGGQRFDSFAMDIESHAIASQTGRNAALTALSQRVRSLVGPTYPLGAIIPAPVGLAKKQGGWTVFPYTMLARTYDVFLPMAYYTYHAHGASAVYADAVANVHILHAQKGCATTPIHLIGGISERSSTLETQAFVRAVRDTSCYGASVYGWAGTSLAAWRKLAVVGR